MSELEVRAPNAATDPVVTMYGPGAAMVAEWDADSAVTKGYYSNIFVWACARALAEDVAALPFRVGRDPDEPTEYSTTSPLARLLSPPPYGPNKFTTGQQLLAWSIVQLLVTGRFSWELAYPTGRATRGRMPESLWPLPASRLEPRYSDSPGKYFDGYIFNRAQGRPVNLRDDQVFYYWRPSQHDWRQPESVLQAARLDVSVAVMQDRYDFAFLRNDARPAQIVVHQRFSEAQAKEAFRAQFVGNHAGPDNAGKTAFVETSDDGALPKDSLLIQQIGLSQRDAQFIERYDRKLRAIITAFGVPISRLGDSSERTYSNASTEYEVYLRDRIKPLAKEIANAINVQLAPMFGEELGWFDTSGIDAKVQADTLRSAGLSELLKTRLIKINEGRAALGLAPVDDGDRFLTDVELGLLQQGAATLIVPGTSMAGEPYEAGQELPEPEPPQAETPEPGDMPTDSQGDSASALPDAPPPDKKAATAKEQRDRRARETRRLRAYAATDKRVRGHESTFESAFQSILDQQLKAIQARLGGKRGRQMLRVGGEGRQAAVDAGQIFDVDHWRELTARELRSLYEQIAADAAAALELFASLDLNLPSEWAQDFIEQRSNQLAWNVTDTTYKMIQDQLVEGVAAGEAIPKLAARIEDLFAQTYAHRARTVARTEVISAYNGSTLKAAEMSPAGFATAEWLATPGPRTRRSHAAADGQQVPLGQPFTVGGSELRYPGDPSAPAREVVNCRCTITLLTAADVEQPLPRWEPKP